MSTIFINEIHYDNDGGDTGEFVEIAGPAGSDLEGWRLVFYNGFNGEAYETLFLSGTFVDTQNGYGFLSFDPSSIQNGSPDGVALVDDNDSVVEFLSYEGTFTATDGPASGMSSTDIGVFEPFDTPVGQSLQRTGDGAVNTDFTWTGPVAETRDAENIDQVFGEGEAEEEEEGISVSISASVDAINEGNTGDETEITFTITTTEAPEEGSLVGFVEVQGAEGLDADDLDEASADILENGYEFSIEEGQTTDSFTITITGDREIETDERIIATLENEFEGPATVSETEGSVEVTVRNDDVLVSHFIHEIQGSPDTQIDNFGVQDGSPLDGETVTIEAIVVGDFQDGDGDDGRNLSGFYVQEEDEDADDNSLTSEGVFVFDDDFGVDVNVGDLVQITGVVDEFFGETQIDTIERIVVVSSGNDLPTAAQISLPAASTSLSQNGDVQPDLEAFEGMLVEFTDTLTITEMFQLDRFNEIKLSQGERPEQFTQNNAPDVDGFAAHLQEVGARTITYDDGLNEQNAPIGNLDGFGPTFNSATDIRMGDTIDNLSGVLNYQWAGNSASASTWRVRSTEDGENTFNKVNERPETPEEVGGDLQVASFNVLNYFTTLDDESVTANGSDPRGADSEAEFDRQTEKLVTTLLLMDADILGLVELENDFLEDAPGNAIQFLVEELNSAIEDPAEFYDWVDPGAQFVGEDAISNGIIYKPSSVTLLESDVLVFEESSADTTFALADPLNEFADDFNQVEDLQRNRPAVAASFEVENGAAITVAVNHFKSKGASNLDDLVEDASEALGEGVTQEQLDALTSDPNFNAEDGAAFWNEVRTDAANELVAWLGSDPFDNRNDNYLILGDLNAYPEEDPVQAVLEAAYTDLVDSFVGEDAYSFVFDGQTGTLDYALASAGLAPQVTGATEWDVNADEPDAIDYNLDFGRDPEIFDGSIPFRNSDHSPVIVGLDLAAPEDLLLIGTPQVDALIGAGGDDEIIGKKRSDLIDGGAGDDDARAGRGRDEMFGGRGDDSLKGSFGDDTIMGDEGDDLLRGSPGEDSLVGGDGADSIRGGSGADTLIGGAGDDTLVGRKGPDLFVFDPADGSVDTVTDFNINRDMIGLVGDVTFADLAVSNSDGGDALISLVEGAVFAILEDTDADDLIADMFIQI